MFESWGPGKKSRAGEKKVLLTATFGIHLVISGELSIRNFISFHFWHFWSRRSTPLAARARQKKKQFVISYVTAGVHPKIRRTKFESF